MEHPYEYRMSVKYLTPIALGGSPNFDEEPAQIALAKALGEFAGQLQQAVSKFPEADGWEVNSHGLMLAGNTIILTILLQRPKT